MNQADLTARCLDAALSVILEKETELAYLDSVAGDGDHGAGMARGFRAVVASGAGSSTAGEVLAKAGMAFSNAAGGSSGCGWWLFRGASRHVSHDAGHELVR